MSVVPPVKYPPWWRRLYCRWFRCRLSFDLKRFQVPVVKRLYPHLVAADLVSVQPMVHPPAGWREWKRERREEWYGLGAWLRSKGVPEGWLRRSKYLRPRAYWLMTTEMQ